MARKKKGRKRGREKVRKGASKEASKQSSRQVRKGRKKEQQQGKVSLNTNTETGNPKPVKLRYISETLNRKR